MSEDKTVNSKEKKKNWHVRVTLIMKNEIKTNKIPNYKSKCIENHQISNIPSVLPWESSVCNKSKPKNWGEMCLLLLYIYIAPPPSESKNTVMPHTANEKFHWKRKQKATVQYQPALNFHFQRNRKGNCKSKAYNFSQLKKIYFVSFCFFYYYSAGQIWVLSETLPCSMHRGCRKAGWAFKFHFPAPVVIALSCWGSHMTEWITHQLQLNAPTSWNFSITASQGDRNTFV